MSDELNYGERMVELRAERAELAKTLRQRGYSVRAIGSALGVSHVTVLDDLRSAGAPLDTEHEFRLRYGLPEPPAEHRCVDPVACDHESHGRGAVGAGPVEDMDAWMRSRRDRQTD